MHLIFLLALSAACLALAAASCSYEYMPVPYVNDTDCTLLVRIINDGCSRWDYGSTLARIQCGLVHLAEFKGKAMAAASPCYCTCGNATFSVY